MPFENGVEVLILHLYSHLVHHVEQDASQHAAESIEAQLDHCKNHKSFVSNSRLRIWVQNPEVVGYLVERPPEKVKG